MGRRERRRHAAALGGGSRRVKLDLWNNDDTEKKPAAVSGTISEVPEASEDKGDAVERQAGFVEEQAQDARGLPSGVGDPLSLLVQYSDDDEEEAPGIGPVDPAADGQPQNVDQQVLSFMAELETSGLLKEDALVVEGAEGTATEVPDSSVALETVEVGVDRKSEGVENGQVDERESNLESAKDEKAARAVESQPQVNASELLEKVEEDGASSESCDAQSEDQESGDWRAVPDESSGDFFFWNVKTGETTWDKPPEMQKASRKRKRRENGDAKDAAPEVILLEPPEQKVDEPDQDSEVALKADSSNYKRPSISEQPADSGESLVTLPDWEAVLDQSSGEFFYWNVVTGETAWDKPVGKRPARKRTRESESPGSKLQAGEEAEKLKLEPMVVEDQAPAALDVCDAEVAVDKTAAEAVELMTEEEWKSAEEGKSEKGLSDGRESDESQKAAVASADEYAPDQSESGESRGSEPEWEKVPDKESGDFYYWNVRTGETTWEEPEGWQEQVEKTARSETLTADGEAKAESPSIRNGSKLIGQADGSLGPLVSAEGAGDADGGGKDWAERNGETDQDPSDGKRCGTSGLEGSAAGGDVSGMSGMWNGEESSKRRKDRCRSRDLKSDSTSERQNLKAAVETTNDKVEAAVASPFVADLVARAEAIAERAKHVAGSALRNLSTLVRFAIEADVRVADCRALRAKQPSTGESFWHHTELQLQRLDVVFAVESLAEEASRDCEVPLAMTPGVEQQKGAAIPLKYAALLDVPSGVDLSDRPGSSDGVLKRTTAITVAELQKKPAVGNWRQRLAARRQVLTAYSDTSADTLEEGEIQSDGDGPKRAQHRDAPILPPVEEVREEEGEILLSKTDEQPEATDATVATDTLGVAAMDIDATPLDATGMLAKMRLSPHFDSSTPALPSSDVDSPRLLAALPSPVPLPSPAFDDALVPPPPPPEDEEWAPPPPLDNGASTPPPLPEDIPIPEEPPLPESPPVPPPPEDVSSPPMPPDTSVEMGALVAAAEFFPSEVPAWDHSSVLEGESAYAAVQDVEVPLPKGVIAAAPVTVTYTGSLVPIGSYGADYGEQALDGAVAVAPFSSDMGEDVTLVANYGKVATPIPISSLPVTTGKKGEKDKVVKLKKRTPVPVAATTSKANKKVFSMLDKWKAAKEELHDKNGDEEEEEDLFNGERLQKKKLKEIEDWRMQQIESGQALENANFQPLEGDWRQRVQRAKKQAAKVASKETAESAEAQQSAQIDGKPQAEVAPAPEGEAVTEEKKRHRKKKPDIKALSQGLPSGWKAFWDKESGEVYYGNLTTSETSWERPTA